MFGKLKDKLKSALSVFSKKTEEEAEEISQVEGEMPSKPKGQQAKKKEKPTTKKEETLKKEEAPEKEKAPKKQRTKESAKALEEVEQQETKKAPEKKEIVKAEKQEHKETPKKAIEEKSVEAKETKEKEPSLVEEKKVIIIEKEKAIRKEKFIEEKKQEEKAKEKKGFFSKVKDTFTFKKEGAQKAEAKKTESKKEKAKTPVEKDEIKEITAEARQEAPEPESKDLETPEADEAQEKGFFGKIKQSLTTKTISAEKFEELFWELEVALLENNVSVAVIEKIKEDLKEELVDKPLPRDVPRKIQETLKNTLSEILTLDKVDILKNIEKNEGPYVIALFGINGSGKTTSVAKLAHLLKENKMSVVLAACDTFRAAAIQQLEEHAEKLGVKMIKHDYGSDAAAVAFDAIKYAGKNKIDVVLIDTAGRLHSNTNLMAELEKIIRITKPHMKIFVGESITGNDCIEQAQKFNELVELDGAILTKTDVDEKGGAPLSISYVIKKPVLFLGMGQNYEDLEAFDKDVVLARLGL